MLVLFIVLIAAPLVIRRLGIKINFEAMDLMQPLDSGMAHNDTTDIYTGSHLPKGFHSGSKVGSS